MLKIDITNLVDETDRPASKPYEKISLPKPIDLAS